MATLNQIVERIGYALNAPINTVLKENLKFSVKYWRAMLIRRDVQANGLSDEFLQRIPIDLIKVDKLDACDYTLGCDFILRSKYRVPKPVRLKTDVTFKFVGVYDQNDNLKPAVYSEVEEMRYRKFNTYTSKSLTYNYTNGYLYFFNNTLLKKAVIQAIFADPAEVNTVCDEECYNDDMQFPIADDMIQVIMQGILKGEFPLQTPLDEEVDIESNKVKPDE